MRSTSIPFAVRLIGFRDEEAQVIEASLVGEHGKGYGYFRLLDDNLQDPDVYVVNAGEVKALATLSELTPSDVRPALLVGEAEAVLPYPSVDRPLQPTVFLDALDDLIEKRADALSRLDASGVISVPERRRPTRVALDLSDQAEYERLRVRRRAEGGILIVDKNPAFRDYVSELVKRHNLPVAWVNDENKAAHLCRTQGFAVVLINTSVASIEPYDLCEEIKSVSQGDEATVIFLVGKPFEYDVRRAHASGVDGFLNKPVAAHHLQSVLKKFLPALSK
jgi:CheY-like chemotaxis protein